jgi:HD-GYP domain-containing protein (c-di-GMP phosphodiesterase class II)
MKTSDNLFIIVAVVSVIAVMVVLFVLLVLIKKKNRQTERIQFLQSFIEQFKPALGMEKNLDYILLKTQELVEAPNYSFYLYNPSNQRYTLKAVRQLTADTNIAPAYSGLLPYEKEKFDPPLSLTKEHVTNAAAITKDGEVPLLTVPIKGGKGIIRIGPIANVPSRMMQEFNQLSTLLEIPLKNLIEEEDQRRNYEVLETSAKAVKYINRLFIHETEFIKLIAQTCVKTSQPALALLIESGPSFQKAVYSHQTGDHVIGQADILRKIMALAGDQPFTMIPNTSDRFEELRKLLSASRHGYFVTSQFTLLGKQYLILFAFERTKKEDEGLRSQAVKTLWTQIRQYKQIKEHTKQDSLAYIDFLKCIADLIDQMSPFTTGASKLTSNYSMAIAKEMGLSPYHIQTIGLAAYLNNIGIIGLSDGLLNKEGVYSDKEYEQMKLHSEIGAAIIENTIALDDVAAYVRHHHERIDGNGYPSRLKGEQIPSGARIIAVVQTFLAKINGRNYRDPLPFDDALKLLRDSAGSQLDQRIVSAFLQWYEKRRSMKRGQNSALGNCWDLCSVPSSICSGCPAYKASAKNCWEYEHNNCRAHGKSCVTCFVYSEAMARMGQVKKAVM